MRARAIIVGALGILIATALLAAPAAAKGWEHSRIEVASARLSRPIVERGEDAWRFFDEMGFGEAKWEAPNVGGTLRPGLKLGVGYAARVTFACGPSSAGSFAITLYPAADGGPQLFVPNERKLCDGAIVEAGWWPLRTDLLRPFFGRGLPRPPEAAVGSSPVAAAAPSGASATVRWVVAVLLASMLLAGIVVGLRRYHRE